MIAGLASAGGDVDAFTSNVSHRAANAVACSTCLSVSFDLGGFRSPAAVLQWLHVVASLHHCHASVNFTVKHA